MRKFFVRTQNVGKFLAGVQQLGGRGAPEAALMLAAGRPGYGKSRTALWWAVEKKAVFIRLKAACTPHWFLSDLVRELGGDRPAHRTKDLFTQAVALLAQRQPALVIDEIENALHDRRVLDTVRDVTDLAGVEAILCGLAETKGALKREAQIWSRIAALVEFEPVGEADVRLLADKLCECDLADDVIQAIAKGCGGRVREVMNALAVAERSGRNSQGRKTTLASLDGAALFKEWQFEGNVARLADRRGAA